PAGPRPEWQIPLAPPGAPGTFAATVHVHYVDALGRGSVPVVAQVPAPDGSPSPVRLRLAADRVARVGSATLLIENPDARPIAGRVVVVLAGGLATDPESLPARVAASARTTVPLVLENRAALPPGSYPAYALFEYTASGEHHAAVARADVEVVADAGGRRAIPSAWSGTRATWPARAPSTAPTAASRSASSSTGRHGMGTVSRAPASRTSATARAMRTRPTRAWTAPWRRWRAAPSSATPTASPRST